MSTRSFIARKLEDQNPLNADCWGCSWYGRYHHSDGYPTGLGAFLFEALHTQFFGNLKMMLYFLLDTGTAECGWSSLLGNDLTLEAVSPEDHTKHFQQEWRHREQGDFEWWKDTQDGQIALKSPVAYSKRPTSEEQPYKVLPQNDLGWLEWGYIFDEQQYKMLVYKLYPKPHKVAEIDLHANNVDWSAIEQEE